MADIQKYICRECDYETEVYSGRGFFNQHISQVVCGSCHSVQNLTVGGIIAEMVPSFSSEFGRLCPNCMSTELKLWDGSTCPKCGGKMTAEGDKVFWC